MPSKKLAHKRRPMCDLEKTKSRTPKSVLATSITRNANEEVNTAENHNKFVPDQNALLDTKKHELPLCSPHALALIKHDGTD